MQTFLDELINWFITNFWTLIFIFATIIVGYIIYKILKRQITKRTEHGKIDERTGKLILKFFKYIFIIIIVLMIFSQFTEAIGLIAGFLTLSLGTIIGFASMNTLGNVIAGLIIMSSKPFVKGDRIIFDDSLTDVIEIKLIYTVLIDLDGVKISVPNQKLLTESIKSLGKTKVIRRQVVISAGYDEDPNKVERALLEAAVTVPAILKEPKPYVMMTNFLNFAVEYRLYVYIREIKRIKRIEGNLYRAVFDTFKKYDIDISTPEILRQIQ